MGPMTFMAGLAALVFSVVSLALDLIDEDPDEVNRSTLESWRAMRPARKFEVAGMIAVAAGLMWSA